MADEQGRPDDVTQTGRDFRFVDAHHHLWDLRNAGYAWLKSNRDMARYLGDYSRICSDYGVAQYKRDGRAAGLYKSVHIETADCPDPVTETAWVQAVADADPDGFPHAIIGTADLAARDCGDVLDRHAEYRNFRGIRMVTFRDPRFIYTPGFSDGLGQLANRGMVLDLDVDWPLMPVFSDLADEHGDLKFILGHAGFPKSREADYFRYWSEAIGNLAARPNVSCKISGLGMIDHDWTIDSIRPWVETCLLSFGSERCMFATNWPVDSLFSSYDGLVTAYKSIVADLSSDERLRLFSGNAETLYRI